jgi:tetratricopeptide (TPR) repeat protein
VSQSPTQYESLSDDAEYMRRWDEMALLLAQGHSMSGRERDCCFLNIGKHPFANVSSVTALDFPDDSRGIGLVDWDHDGDQDLWMTCRTAPRVRLLRNEVGNRQSHLTVKLEGRQCNRDAIGARIELELGGESPRTLIRTVRAGEAFVSQHSKWTHFGLGGEPQIKRLRVRWPGRQEFDEFSNIQPNGRYRIVEGSAPVRDNASPRKTALEPGEQKPNTPTQKSRSLLVFRKNLPKLELNDLDGRPAPFDPGQHPQSGRLTSDIRLPTPGTQHLTSPVQHPASNSQHRATLINLWASWCQPCLVELSDFAAHYESLQAEGIEIVAVSVDGVGQDPGSRDAARALAQKSGWPFPVRLASDQAIELLTMLDNATFYFQQPLPVPTSFLLDRRGHVAAIYKGAVTSEQVLKDARLLDAPPEQFEQAAAFFPGRDGLRYFHLHPLSFAAAYIEGEYYDDAKSHIEQFLDQRKKDDLRALNANAAAREKELVRSYQMLVAIARLMGKPRDEIAAYHELERLQTLPPAMAARVALLVASQNQIEEATRRVEALAAAHADSAAVLDLAGSTYLRLGANRPAIEVFRRAVQLEQTNVMFRFNLGTALQAAGDAATAVETYESVLADQPEMMAAANNLAWILASHPNKSVRSPQKARKLAELACQKTHYQEPAYLDTLGVAAAADGDFDTAIKMAQQSAELYDARNNDAAAGVRERISGYRKGVVYIAP